MDNILTMVESGSVILLAVLAVSACDQRLSGSPRVKALVIGGIFAIVGIIVMQNAVEIIPGIRTDPRAAVIAVSAGFGGPLAALVTTPILAYLRYHQGGVGAVPGTTYIVGVGVLATLVWHWWFNVAQRRANQYYVLAQAAVAGLGPVVILFFVSQAPWAIYLKSNALAAPTNVIAAVLIGIMVVRDRDRASALSDRREVLARIRNIAANAPVILFQMVRQANGEPRFTYVSDGAQRLLGMSPDLVMDDFDLFRSVTESDAIEEISEKLSASEQDGRSWIHELECVRPDGGVAFLRIEAGFRSDATDSSVWEGAISDISEQKRVERMKDDFISTVSHELRTPLTSIRGSLGLVVGNAGSQIPPKLLSILQIANRNAERLVVLINDILDMQKIRAGQMRFELTEEPARPLIEQAIVAAQNYLPEKGVRIVLFDDAPDARVEIDPDRLAQVMANLLSNAIKFSPDGGTVHVSTELRQNIFRISVRDEGQGIPEEFADRVFDQFSQAQTSSTRKTGGTGLGLNISKALVEAMNGTLSFDSVPGEGATFHIALASPTFIRTPIGGKGGMEGRRVLVCSTDGQLTQNVGKALLDKSLLADIAPDIDSAHDMAMTRDYAALVFDASSEPLPELFTAFRGEEQTQNLPVIIISGEASSEQGVLTDAHTGIIDWLERPLDEERLKSAVSEAFTTISNTCPRVLHVEDDPSLREVIRQNLGEAVHYTGARSLAIAQKEVALRRFDLILLDLDLPDGLGAELLQDLPDETKVVIFSAFDVPPDVIDRTVGVMVKSRVRETDVAQAVLGALPTPQMRPEAKTA